MIFEEQTAMFRVGDIVTRDGTDLQRIIEIDHANGCMTVECIRTPKSGWCKIGETEFNLIRRYAYPGEMIDAPPPRVILPGAQNATQETRFGGPESAA